KNDRLIEPNQVFFVSESNTLIEPNKELICINNSDDANTNETTLNVNDTFKDWNELDTIDKTIVRRYVYKCWKAGVHNSKKMEDIVLYRNSITVKTNCSWQASFNFGKRTTVIHLTKIIDDHNHQCDQTTIELAPKNLRFSQAILNKIKHYTTNRHFNAG
ncbi:43102_t:CDS:2, partial [Gigaspora margarita]